MTSFLSLVLAYLTLTASANQKNGSGANIFGSVGRGLTKEISSVKQPITETLVDIGSSQCSNVKKIFGVDYEQIEGEKEPDLNRLTLEFNDNAVRIIYNITSAAREIPLARNFNPQQKLIIFVHGFTDDPTKSSFRTISNALMNIGEFNVLALDGSSLIKWLYLRSSSYVRFMGQKLGEVLAAMVKGGLDPSAIHIIGHSLGSHISGFTGKTFTDLTGLQIGRISGLDPAGPCFSHVDPELRLKATDAAFVDVMHTDAGVYGLRDPVGHVDFYPNGGNEQPNCFFQTCSHSRAWLYYVESVLAPEAYPALHCKDWDAFKKRQCENQISNMGYGCKRSATGLYFLQTGEDPPYGLGMKGAVYKNNEGVVKNIGSTVLKLL